MSGHTPGPWKLQLGKGIQYDYIINGPDKGPVACFEHYKQHTKKETKANARLIAAAPDLLEALKHLEHNARKSGANMGLALDIARAAIAKATGEAT